MCSHVSSDGDEAVINNNATDNTSKTPNEVGVHVSDNVSGQKLNEAKCVSENGIPQSVKDTLSAAFYGTTSGTDSDRDSYLDIRQVGTQIPMAQILLVTKLDLYMT